MAAPKVMEAQQRRRPLSRSQIYYREWRNLRAPAQVAARLDPLGRSLARPGRLVMPARPSLCAARFGALLHTLRPAQFACHHTRPTVHSARLLCVDAAHTKRARERERDGRAQAQAVALGHARLAQMAKRLQLWPLAAFISSAAARSTTTTTTRTSGCGELRRTIVNDAAAAVDDDDQAGAHSHSQRSLRALSTARLLALSTAHTKRLFVWEYQGKSSPASERACAVCACREPPVRSFARSFARSLSLALARAFRERARIFLSLAC